jgi:hypothetical protein
MADETIDDLNKLEAIHAAMSSIADDMQDDEIRRGLHGTAKEPGRADTPYYRLNRQLYEFKQVVLSLEYQEQAQRDHDLNSRMYGSSGASEDDEYAEAERAMHAAEETALSFPPHPGVLNDLGSLAARGGYYAAQRRAELEEMRKKIASGAPEVVDFEPPADWNAPVVEDDDGE